MGKTSAIAHSALAAVVAGTLAFKAADANADGVPGVVLTVSQNVTDWSGFYIGGRVGGAWSDVDWTQNVNYFNTNGPIVVGSDSSFSPSGVAGGVFGGGNLQLGQWIFGAELSYSGTDLSTSTASPFFPAIDTFTTELNWLATVEGRLGYSWNRTLVFVKGGWAGGDVKMELTDNAAGITASTTTFADGWTIGGGVEYAVCDSVILGLEYDYTTLNVSGTTVTCPLCGTGVGFGTPVIDSDIKIQSVMARLSYLFMPED